MSGRTMEAREMGEMNDVINAVSSAAVVQRRLYRLINAYCEPHGILDGLYESLEDAVLEAIAWLQERGVDPLLGLIGVEVSAANGDWRTLRLPGALLCPLLCPLPA